MSFINSDTSSSIAIWISFIYFYSLISVSRTCKTMLNKGGDSWHPCLVPDLRRNALSISPLNVMLAMCHHIWPLLSWGTLSLYAHFLKIFFSHKWILNFIKAFFSPFIEMIAWLLFFNSLMWHIILIHLQTFLPINLFIGP